MREAARDDAIVEAAAAGRTQAAIAAEHGLTQGRVSQIVASTPPAVDGPI